MGERGDIARRNREKVLQEEARRKTLSPEQRAKEDEQRALGRNPDGTVRSESRSADEEQALIELVQKKNLELQERAAMRRGELVAVTALNQGLREKIAELESLLASAPGMTTVNSLRNEITSYRGEILALERAQKQLSPLLASYGFSPMAAELPSPSPAPTKKDSGKPPEIKADIRRVPASCGVRKNA